MNLSKKSLGSIFIPISIIAAIVSLVWFCVWASGSGNMDTLIIVGLVLGIAVNVVLIFKDSNYLIVVSTICYTFSAVRLLTNSVGSFVDAFQGINMFGDASQVSTITKLAIIMFISVISSIVASFMKRVKQ
ncbi:MAG: hypothetical protein ACK5LL_05675 [Suipraeoptans sp.]